MLNIEEKRFIKEFLETKIPAIYKLDDTDNILYVEHLYFDICPDLLKGKKMSRENFEKEIKDYSIYLSQINFFDFDLDEIEHFKKINLVFQLLINNMI